MGSSTQPKPSVTDSPWYWLYLFCTAGLIALLLVGPKYAFRQSQIERSGQGRQRAVQNTSGREPITSLSDDEHHRIPLRPLYYILGAILVIAWIKLAVARMKKIQPAVPKDGRSVASP